MEMEKDRKTPALFGFYIFAALVTVCLFFGALILDKPKTDGSVSDFSGQWYGDENMTVPADVGEPETEDGRAEFYAAVPDTVQNGWRLYFRAKNCLLDVYLDGEYITGVESINEFYGKSPGTVWVTLPLTEHDAGKTIRIEFKACYDDSSCYLDSMSIGPGDEVLLGAAAERTVGVVTCIILIFTGMMLILVHIAMHRSAAREYTRDLMYLGCFAIATAVWALCETKVLQIFSVNSGAVHMLSCMSIMLIIMPLFLFFRRDVSKKNHWIITAVAALTILDFFICTVLHFTGIADLHQTLTATHIVIGISAVGVVYANYLRIFRNKARKNTDIMAGVGMVIFAFTAVLDLIRYRTGSVSDSSLFTRIGLLIYVMILGVCSLTYVIEMVKKGMTSDLISRLAYEDGLTGLGNRTAYGERLEELEGKPAVIFMFDINNLKYVNDNIGHRAGDDMIRSGAELISSVFGKAGECYRIGGDEFVCLAREDADPQALEEEFYAKMDEINSGGKLGFPLVIALGWEPYTGENDIKTAVDAADHNMYKKKSELKKSAAEPAKI